MLYEVITVILVTQLVKTAENGQTGCRNDGINAAGILEETLSPVLVTLDQALAKFKGAKLEC